VPTKKNLPPLLIIRGLFLLLTGKLTFQTKFKNKYVKVDDKTFTVFRKVLLNTIPSNLKDPKPKAILKIFFKFNRFSPATNKILSLIPIPLIVSQIGFISKTWLFSEETGVFCGLYEWETTEAAKNYIKSYVIKLMEKRSLPGSLKYKITKSPD